MGEAEFYLRFALLVVGGLVGGFVGFLLNVWLQSTKEQREARAAKYAIQAEMDCAARDAEAYLQPGAVKRVGWRLSLRMYESGLPKLMYVGAIEHQIADALVNYYQNLEAFNRSLDLVEDHYTDGRNEPAYREVGRAHLKAIEITSGDALRRLSADPECEPGLSARIEEKLAKRDGRTLYDIARGQSGFL